MACSGCGLSDEAGSGQSGPGHLLYLQSQTARLTFKQVCNQGLFLHRAVVSYIIFSPKAVMKGECRGVGWTNR